MDIRQALDELEEREQVKISLPVIKAVIAVESAGRGHLSDGRAKILFEGHKFWHWLEKSGKDPKALQAGNENLIYEKWTRAHYQVGAKEYERLERAKSIDPKAAVYATSWGFSKFLAKIWSTSSKEENTKMSRNLKHDNTNQNISISWIF